MTHPALIGIAPVLCLYTRRGKMKKSSSGQSTLEYLIILAVVIGAIVFIAGALKPKLENTYGGLGDKMKAKVDTVNF